MFSRFAKSPNRVFIVHDENDKQTKQCLLETIAVVHKFCTNAFVYSHDVSLCSLLEQYIHPNSYSKHGDDFSELETEKTKTLVVFDMRNNKKYDEFDARGFIGRNDCLCVFIGDQTKKKVFVMCDVVISPHAKFEQLCLGKRPQQGQWLHCQQKTGRWTRQKFFVEQEETCRKKNEKQAFDFILTFIPIQDIVCIVDNYICTQLEPYSMF